MFHFHDYGRKILPLFVKDAATGTIWGTPASPPPNMATLAGFFDLKTLSEFSLFFHASRLLSR